jgi:hypothetical protein
VLPEVEKIVTSDGRPVHLSHSGNDRAIAGSSSGAIAAFTAAWEHPEAFSRVLSAIGTYVGLRGGEVYPTLIRKFEPKPIRVFLQDGSNDLNIYGGDWWMANQTMERALEFSGYEVNHEWGDGMHSGKHMGAILPDALRWLWKDWPKPVARGQTKNGALKALLIPGEGWKAEGHGANVRGIGFNTKGEAVLVVVPDRRASPGGPAPDSADTQGAADVIRFGAYGQQYRGGAHGLTVISRDKTIADVGDVATVADGMAVRDLVAAHNGNLYATEVCAQGRVWLIRPSGEKLVVDSGLRSATGITLSPDQSQLYVADGGSHWVYSYQVRRNGTLVDKQRYFWLHTADWEDESHAGGMCCDQAGWLYVATDLGVQVCDQAGRVNAILPTPGGRVTDVCFGGKKFDTLYATCAGMIYRRKLNATAANPWAPPILPPVPKL